MIECKKTQSHVLWGIKLRGSDVLACVSKDACKVRKRMTTETIMTGNKGGKRTKNKYILLCLFQNIFIYTYYSNHDPTAFSRCCCRNSSNSSLAL
jgi:hypothetical protein